MAHVTIIMATSGASSEPGAFGKVTMVKHGDWR